MDEPEFVEQPLTGFDYSYWFECAGCGTRVNIAADLYELQTSYTPTRPQAAFSRCDECDAEVDVTELRPVLRNLDDIALQDDRVGRLYWYHSITYENWPDAEAYADAYKEQIANGPAFWRGWSSPEQLLKDHTSKAVHIGTYEAAIENMLRRLHNQDDRDGSPPQYWLHRVQIHLEPGDLAPGAGEEPTDWVGNVPLSMLDDEYGGARAVRYVNVNEAHGSISMAIHPAVNATVATIPIPVESVAVETAAAAAAAAQAVTALAEIAPLRPDTTGIDHMYLRCPSALERKFPDPADPAPQRIEAVAEQLDAYGSQLEQIWAELKTTLELEYLPEVNDQVRCRFHDALAHTGSRRIPPEFSADGRTAGPPSRRGRPFRPRPDARHPIRTVRDDAYDASAMNRSRLRGNCWSRCSWHLPPSNEVQKSSALSLNATNLRSGWRSTSARTICVPMRWRRYLRATSMNKISRAIASTAGSMPYDSLSHIFLCGRA